MHFDHLINNSPYSITVTKQRPFVKERTIRKAGVKTFGVELSEFFSLLESERR